MLFFFLTMPLVFFFIICFIPKTNILLLKRVSLFFSLLIFFFNIYFYIIFDIFYSLFQFRFDFYFWSGFYYSIGLDSISIFFLLLTTFLMPICFLVNWQSVKYRVKDFILLLFFLEFLLLNIFLSLDLFFFYFFFESVLIPMFFMIGIWGSRQRKINAAYQFFFYTFLGSIFMLLSIFILYLHVGTTHLDIIKNSFFSFNRQIIIWFGFFLAFAIKVPMIPFHIWLPEAHVEAPTTGSILLAGILLKLGTYGFLRFLIFLFPYGSNFFTPIIFVFCLLGVIFGSFSTIRQIDLKKIIAYSSVVHMNFAILGLFSNSLDGLQGSFFLMLSHGIISSALFFCIGVLYDRYHTRLVYFYGGLTQFMPIFSIFFIFFILSNMAFPGTSGFIGEILVLISIFTLNNKVALLLSFSMVFSAIYSLWLFNRVMFGELRCFFYTKNNLFFYKNFFLIFSDLTKREFFIFIPLFILNLLFGIYPNLIFNFSYLCLLILV